MHFDFPITLSARFLLRRRIRKEQEKTSTVVEETPSYLVVQTITADGTVVYAETFSTRDSAEQAKKVADERVRRISMRRHADLLELPYDIR